MTVRFSDESGELFGISPAEAAASTATRKRLQALLDAMLEDSIAAPPPLSNWNTFVEGLRFRV